MASLVTNNGIANIVAALVAYASRPQWVGYGTGSGQGIASTLLAAGVQNRVVGITSQQTTSKTGDTFRVAATITADATRDITEVGVFTNDSGSTLSLYGDFPVVTLANGDAIDFTIDMVVA